MPIAHAVHGFLARAFSAAVGNAPSRKFLVCGASLLGMHAQAAAWGVQSRVVSTSPYQTTIALSVEGTLPSGSRLVARYFGDPSAWSGRGVSLRLDASSCGPIGSGIDPIVGGGSVGMFDFSGSMLGTLGRCELTATFSATSTVSFEADPSRPAGSVYSPSTRIPLWMDGDLVHGDLPSKPLAPISKPWAGDLRDFAIFGAVSVKVSDRISVSGGWIGSNGSVELGADARAVGISASGSVFLRERAQVATDVLAGGGLSSQNQVVIGGEAIAGNPGKWAVPTQTVTPGTLDVSVWGGKDRAVEPGTYRDLHAWSGAKVRLKSGTYRFRSFVLETDDSLIVDATDGPVTVLVQGDVQCGDRSKVRLVGTETPSRFHVHSEQTSLLRIGTDVQFRGLIEAPKATIDVFSRTLIDGALHGNSVILEPDVGSIVGGNRNAPPRIDSWYDTLVYVGDTWSYQAHAVDADRDALTWSVLKAPAGMSLGSATGLCTWKPLDTGRVQFQLTVSDGHGGLDVQSVLVHARLRNRAPVITSEAPTMVKEGEAYSYVVKATDADGDALTFTAGTLPSGMTFDAGTATFGWTPGFEQSGSYPLSVSVSDGKGGVTSQTWMLVVSDVNRAPVITSEASTTAKEGEAYSYVVKATDADGDALTFTAGTLPSGMTFDVGTATFAWNPGFEQSGSYPLSVSGSDGKGGVTSQTWMLVVSDANRAPVITSEAPTMVKEGEAYSYVVKATDADGDALTFTAGTLPSGMTFDAGTATFGWTPGFEQSGSYPLSVSVSDGKGGVTSQTWMLVVSDANRAPVITSEAPTSVKEGEAYSYVVKAADADGDALTFTAGTLPNGMTFDVGTATFAWNPGFEQSGSCPLSVSVSDGKGGVTSQTWMLVVSDANRAPVITSEAPVTGKEGDVYSYIVTATDADGDALSFFSTNLVDGMRFDSASHCFSWVPSFDQSGYHEISIFVRDGKGGIDSQVVAISVSNRNRVPIFKTSPPNGGRVGESYRYSPQVEDFDGDELILAARILPRGAIYDQVRNQIVWVPSSKGVFSFRFVVFDGVDSSEQRFDVRTSSSAVCDWVEELDLARQFDPSNKLLATLPCEAIQYDVDTFDVNVDPITLRGGYCAINLPPQSDHYYCGNGTADAPFAGWYGPCVEVSEGLVRCAGSRQGYAGCYYVSGAPYVYLRNAGDDLVLSGCGGSVKVAKPPERIYVGDGVVWHPAEDSIRVGIDSVVLMNAPVWIERIAGGLKFVPSDLDTGKYSVAIKVFARSGASIVRFNLVVRPRKSLGPKIVSLPPLEFGENGVLRWVVRVDSQPGLKLTYQSLGSGAFVGNEFFAISNPPPNGDHAFGVSVCDAYQRCDAKLWHVFGGFEHRSPLVLESLRGEYQIGDTIEVFALRRGLGEFSVAWGDSVVKLDEGVYRFGPIPKGYSHLEVKDVGSGAIVQRLSFWAGPKPNESPIISSVPTHQAAVGQEYRYAPIWIDSNNDPVVLRLIRAPAGATLLRDTLRWIPQTEDAGIHEFEVEASDGFGGIAGQVWQVTVPTGTNAMPVVISKPEVELFAGQRYQYRVRAMDPDGDVLTYRIQASPVGASMNEQGELAWTPAISDTGSHRFALDVSDGRWAVTQSWVVDVQVDRVGPALSLSVPLTGRLGDTITIHAAAADPSGITQITLSLNGLPLALQDDSVRAVLTDIGLVAVEFRASDRFENSSVRRAFVDVHLGQPGDTAKPVIALRWTPESPRVGEQVNIQLDASDVSGIGRRVLRVDGQELELSTSGAATWTATRAGRLPVEVVAWDLVGNSLRRDASIDVQAQSPEGSAPVASLTGIGSVILPASEDPEVSGMVEIRGTAEAGPWSEGVLHWVASGSSAPLEIGRIVAPTTNGILGYLDATQLENGPGILRLTVRDASGREAQSEVPLRIVGEKKLGIFTVAFTDLSLALSGMDASATRTYDSRRRAQQGDFGFGWDLDLSRVDVVENMPQGDGWSLTWAGPFGRTLESNRKHTVTVRIPGLKTQEFLAKPEVTLACGGASICFSVPNSGTMTYEAQPGTYGKLRPADVGERFEIMGGTLVSADDLVNEDGEVQSYDPDEYILTLADGSEWWLDQKAGRVFQIKDANGNLVQFSGNQIIHSDGRGIQLVRDGQNRVTEARDGTGRVVRYAYDADGNLATVTDPGGNTTRFWYDADHYLTDIVDARGVKALRIEYDSAGRVVRQITAKGDTVKSEHDLANGIESVVSPSGARTSYTYNDRGDVTSKTVDGHTWRYTVDVKGKVTRIDNPDGTYTTSTFDADGNEIESVDALGHRTARTFQPGSDRILAETDAIGRITRYEYDARGNLLRSIGPGGRAMSRQGVDAKGQVVADTGATGEVTTYTYDATGHRLSQTDAQGRITRWTYDARGNLLTETDALGRTVRHAYDAIGNRTSTTTPDGRTSTTEYTSFGKPRQVTDALGRKTQTVYDATGQAIASIRADGSSTSRTYDGDGRVTSTSDAAGRTTTMRYDAEGRLLGTAFSDSAEVKSEYDAMGRRTASIDAQGNRTTYEYDAAGRDTLVRDALGHETRSRYDAVGRKIEVVDALGRTTRTHYDLFDRVTKVVYPDNSFDSTEYDAAGRKTAMVDAMLRRTEFGYDEAGQLVSVKDASGEVTRYGYDATGNRVAQTDAKGRTTSFHYDNLGRLTAKVYPDGAKDSTEYDAVGQVVRHIAPNGDATRFEYDVLGREVKRILPSGKSISTTWNTDGSRASVLDDRGRTRYGYDARGRLVSVTNPDGTVMSYGYDRSGRIVKRGTPWGETRYVVNALGLVDTVVDRRAGATSYDYDALGRTTSVSRPNGVQSLYGYTDRGLLGSLRHVRGASEVASFTYTFDASGLRTGAGETFGGVTNPVSWTHDLNQRLTDETRSGATQSWAYDAVSNRTGQTAGGSSITAVFDTRDRLTSLGNASYSWDIAGRLRSRAVSGATTTYTWGDADRLTRVDLPSGGSVSYGYDAQGLMVSRTSAAGTTGFVWDGTLPYGQVVATTSSTGSLDSRWVYGSDRLAEIHGDTVLWLLTDGLGNVRALTDSIGAVVGRSDFDAWGNRTLDAGRTSAFGYRGEWADPATGMVFLRARWMDPNTGRFVSEDPYGGRVEGPASLHRYLYANQSPVMMFDPNGRFGIGGVGVDILISMAVPNWSFFKLISGPSSKTDNAQLAGESVIPLAKAMTISAINKAWNNHYSVKMFFGDEESRFTRNKDLAYRYYRILEGLNDKIRFYRKADPLSYAESFWGLRGKIWLKDLYFSSAVDGWNLDSKAGVLIHEMSHIMNWTLDHKYGIRREAKALVLAENDPETACDNADSYEYFAEWSE